MKKKILHFTIANRAGGVTKFVLELWKHIDKERFQFDFVTSDKHLDFAEELESEGCKIHYLTVYAEDDRERFNQEVEKMLDYGYDSVHLHTGSWRGGFFLEELAQKKKVPQIIIHAHNSAIFAQDGKVEEEMRKQHYKIRELLTENTATDFLACSDTAADWLYGDRIPKKRIEFIPNSVETKNFRFNSEMRNRYRSSLGYEQFHYVIGHVGQFVHQKNHEFLIEVFRQIEKENANARLMLVGVGRLQDTIKETVCKYGLEQKVQFLNKRNDVNSLMQAMDVFILPSRFEGLPIVLVEAQAAGLKCIVSDNITSMAKVTDNVEFLPLEYDAWIRKIQAYSNGYERKDMSSIVEQAGYGIESLVKKMETIYNYNYNLLY